ncbi:MAG: hypothetical protein P8R54_32175 [Myxococcota bacterium]|nr:hypothetical protein [Myxococcota bacterium]
MERTERDWQSLSADLLVRAYSLGGGNTANMVAFRLPDRGLGVISPSARVRDGVLEALEEHGTVRALIAPNAYHTLGLPVWSQRFPEAGVYAGEAALARIRKRIPGLDVAPVSILHTGEDAALIELPQMRNGETLLRTTVDGREAWYGGDVFLNVNVDALSGALGMFFRVAGMGPGFVVNPLNRVVMMRDRGAVRAWAAETLGDVGVVIPGHGAVLTGDGLGARMTAML